MCAFPRPAILLLTAIAVGCGDDRTPDRRPAPSGTAIDPGVEIRLEQVAAGLTAPVALVESPDSTGRLFVLEQPGRIRILDAGGALVATPFLDLTDRITPLDPAYDERGLLGMAFHPQFASNGRFFVYYTAPPRLTTPAGFDHVNVISEFTAAGGTTVDPASERILLEVDHPQVNHNGGTLAFGPDGMLYISIGDGGNADDVGPGHVPGGNGQSTDTLLGKILRISVDPTPSGAAYGIPADNPFVSGGGAKEIYAYGFRNPYRFSFDRETGRLILADAGQNLMEEVNLIERGGNYGWNVREGILCFNPADNEAPPAFCPETGARGEPLVPPILTYLHPGARELFDDAIEQQVEGIEEIGIVVVGGFIYRGPEVPELLGTYVFGDWSGASEGSSGVLLIATEQDGAWSFRRANVSGQTDGNVGSNILGFGEDDDGSLYLLTNDEMGPVEGAGRVFRIVPAQGG